MIRRWGHGHSLAAGVGAGVLFATHTWAVLLLVFLGGLLLGRFWNLLHWTGEALREKVLRARKDKRLGDPVLVKPLDVQRHGEFPRGY